MVKFHHHVISESADETSKSRQGHETTWNVGVYVLGERAGYNQKNETSYSWEENTTIHFYMSDIYHVWKNGDCLLKLGEVPCHDSDFNSLLPTNALKYNDGYTPDLTEPQSFYLTFS